MEDVECRLALASDDGKCSFGMLADEQGPVLPAGTYRVLYGLLYRPLARQAAAIVLPGKGLPIPVCADGQVKLVLGESLRQPLEASEQVLTTTFEALLEIDLSGVVVACDHGEFGKRNNCSPRLWGSTRADRTWRRPADGWKASVSRCSLKHRPRPWPFVRRRPRCWRRSNKAMRRRPGSRSRRRERRFRPFPPALPATGLIEPARPRPMPWSASARDACRACGRRIGNSSFRQPCGAERVEQIDWDGARAGKTQFFGCRYDGFLVVPDSGEYEIALASTQAAKLSLDARLVIDHGRAHNMTERSVKLTLTAGPHPLEIEMWNSLGRGGLHLRWRRPADAKRSFPPGPWNAAPPARERLRIFLNYRGWAAFDSKNDQIGCSIFADLAHDLQQSPVGRGTFGLRSAGFLGVPAAAAGITLVALYQDFATN